MAEPVRRADIQADFAGCRVLVTGGSRGIASAIARAFATAGATVAVNYSAGADARAGHPDAAGHLLGMLRAANPACIAIEGDLHDRGVAARLPDAVIAALGGIDIVVLSASQQVLAPFLDMRGDEIEAQLQLNIRANIEILQRAIPPMREQRWGRIITIGSVQEVSPSLEMPIYAMTKSALESLVRTLAVENAPYGITVNNVAPGLIQTDRNAFRRRDMAAWNELAASCSPIGRAGQPEDVVRAALYFASDDAAFTTGTTLFVAGGAQIGGWRRPRRAATPDTQALATSPA